MRLLLIRHGDPDYAADGLTAVGRREAELLADPKERAEHMMLVDLARNDLGRVAKTGTVAGNRRERANE